MHTNQIFTTMMNDAKTDARPLESTGVNKNLASDQPGVPLGVVDSAQVIPKPRKGWHVTVGSDVEAYDSRKLWYCGRVTSINHSTEMAKIRWHQRPHDKTQSLVSWVPINKGQIQPLGTYAQIAAGPPPVPPALVGSILKVKFAGEKTYYRCKVLMIGSTDDFDTDDDRKVTVRFDDDPTADDPCVVDLDKDLWQQISEAPPCEICGEVIRGNGKETTLLCDSPKCGSTYHWGCLKLPFKHVIVGDWLCPKCNKLTTANESKRVRKSTAKKNSAKRAAQASCQHKTSSPKKGKLVDNLDATGTEDSTQPTAAKPFSCKSCGKRFKVLGGLKYHTAKAVCKQVSLLPLPALSGTKDVPLNELQKSAETNSVARHKETLISTIQPCTGQTCCTNSVIDESRWSNSDSVSISRFPNDCNIPADSSVETQHDVCREQTNSPVDIIPTTVTFSTSSPKPTQTNFYTDDIFDCKVKSPSLDDLALLGGLKGGGGIFGDADGLAAQGNTDGLLQLLERVGCLTSVAPLCGTTALHAASARGQTSTIAALLDRNAEINAVNAAGYTPLHLAAEYGRDSAAVALLNAGSDAQVRTSFGDTAAKLASTMGHHSLALTIEKAAGGHVIRENSPDLVRDSMVEDSQETE